MTRRRPALLVAGLFAVPFVAGCSAAVPTAPGCTDTERVALVAQSVPSAAYVPCVATLAPGWSSDRFTVARGSSSFVLHSDRSAGHPVTVTLQRRCETSGATATTPRTAGGRTYLLLRRISPRYAGTLLDVFPGGCVRYEFDFTRGSDIALMADLQSTVGLMSRTELRYRVRSQLGVRLR